MKKLFIVQACESAVVSYLQLLGYSAENSVLPLNPNIIAFVPQLVERQTVFTGDPTVSSLLGAVQRLVEGTTGDVALIVPSHLFSLAVLTCQYEQNAHGRFACDVMPVRFSGEHFIASDVVDIEEDNDTVCPNGYIMISGDNGVHGKKLLLCAA